MDNKRFYNFTLVIYEDDENYATQSFNLAQEKSAIWCRHDEDVNEESGELKKVHLHYVLKLKTACTVSALAKRIGVKENMIEPVKKSLNGCLKYLIHFDNDDKYRYEVKDVKSNDDKLLRRFEELVTKEMSEEEQVEDIEAYLDQTNDYIDLRVFGKYVRKINRWATFRRNFSYFRSVIDSHNAKISAMRYGSLNDYYETVSNQKDYY